MSTTTNRGGRADQWSGPTRADNTELRRHLGARDRILQAAYSDGLHSRPADPDWPWLGVEHVAWLDGRHERNRQRQERLVAWLYRLCAGLLRLFCRRCRRRHKRLERRLRRVGGRVMRSARRRQVRRDRRRWGDDYDLISR